MLQERARQAGYASVQAMTMANAQALHAQTGGAALPTVADHREQQSAAPDLQPPEQAISQDTEPADSVRERSDTIVQGATTSKDREERSDTLPAPQASASSPELPPPSGWWPLPSTADDGSPPSLP